MKNKPMCGSCVFRGRSFKIDKLTHLHCQHPQYDQEWITPWESLRTFGESCEKYEKGERKITAFEQFARFKSHLEKEEYEECAKIKALFASVDFQKENAALIAHLLNSKDGETVRELLTTTP